MTQGHAPGQWQQRTLERLKALGYIGFVCGPGVNWWPVNAHRIKCAGPFTTTKAFDAWRNEQEAADQ